MEITAEENNAHFLKGRESSAPVGSIEEADRYCRRIEELVERIEELPDVRARALLHECLESVIGFYGEGLQRVLQVVARIGESGRLVQDELLRDKVVCALLLIHGLHPIGLEARLRGALDRVRPYMRSHGGDVELLALENDFAHLRLQGTCKNCPSSAVTLELAVRNVIEEACPDLQGFEVEGVTPERLSRAVPGWKTIANAAEIAEGSVLRRSMSNASLILCRVGSDFFAYRDRCPVCNLPIHLGELRGETLRCRAGHNFNIRYAGRSTDGSANHLDPFPLLEENGKLQISGAWMLEVSR